jgi:hypothetical protein
VNPVIWLASLLSVPVAGMAILTYNLEVPVRLAKRVTRDRSPKGCNLSPATRILCSAIVTLDQPSSVVSPLVRSLLVRTVFVAFLLRLALAPLALLHIIRYKKKNLSNM